MDSMSTSEDSVKIASKLYLESIERNYLSMEHLNPLVWLKIGMAAMTAPPQLSSPAVRTAQLPM